MNAVELTDEDARNLDTIQKEIPGWSNRIHQGFFKMLLADCPWVRDILVLGVYHGRDIAIILDLHARYHPGRQLHIVGVDKFSDTPCADWPQEKRTEGWRVAGYGEPPSMEMARARNSHHDPAAQITLLQSDDAAFIAGANPSSFDVVYLDTSHDYETVKRQGLTVPRLLRSRGIICGDDYSNAGTWGVIKAVSEVFPDHKLFGHWIWVVEPTK